MWDSTRSHRTGSCSRAEPSPQNVTKFSLFRSQLKCTSAPRSSEKLQDAQRQIGELERRVREEAAEKNEYAEEKNENEQAFDTEKAWQQQHAEQTAYATAEALQSEQHTADARNAEAYEFLQAQAAQEALSRARYETQEQASMLFRERQYADEANAAFRQSDFQKSKEIDRMRTNADGLQASNSMNRRLQIDLDKERVANRQLKEEAKKTEQMRIETLKLHGCAQEGIKRADEVYDKAVSSGKGTPKDVQAGAGDGSFESAASGIEAGDSVSQPGSSERLKLRNPGGTPISRIPPIVGMSSPSFALPKGLDIKDHIPEEVNIEDKVALMLNKCAENAGSAVPARGRTLSPLEADTNPSGHPDNPNVSLPVSACATLPASPNAQPLHGRLPKQAASEGGVVPSFKPSYRFDEDTGQ